MSTQEQYWEEHYRKVFHTETPWLDYSNERVQAQTFAICLEGGGCVHDRRCLDVGCGWGQFSTCLASLRAREVVGIDFISSAIEAHRQNYPHIRWECGTPTNPAFLRELGDFDTIYLLESLQYFSPRIALAELWRRLKPGGRMVIVVPNGNCPIVKRVRERFQGNYDPPNLTELSGIIAELPGMEVWQARGLFFGEDQRILPYVTGEWSRSDLGTGEPNRLQVVILKTATEALDA